MSKKPVTPPAPKRTRPLAQPKKRPSGIAATIMERCKFIRDNDHRIDNGSIATELGITKQEVCGYLTGSAGLPYGDRFASFILWGLKRDKNLLKDLA